MSDNSGKASVVAGVFRRGRRLRQWGPEILDSGAWAVRWKAPARRQRLSFCVLAQDAADNKSKQSCAVIKVT
jgi:hypothetical protein